ncbi:VWA domain-containing protein [Paenibacillus mesophilus]|uniref:vWA domain-containing protein n=1 Tax=Paenibacillus mesophilus TaxID=2582849 RepID=UPI00110E2E38|nr:BatA and WFA domain-containing protein [Paenibacillus mesophilus]TMV44580.1 VWA domain-containing protein [Paenibacillus mesophilus]
MHFDSLASLWFGLSLPAIVLLYLFKRKYVDTRVSSHLLWNRVLKDMEANRPWQKLRNRLLMIVQLLAAALLVLALMQPWLSSQRTAKAHVVIVLDRSASMTSGIVSPDGTAESRFERAKRMIGDFAENEASDSAITLLGMGEQAEVLLSRETDPAKLRETLARIQPAYGKTAYMEAMSLAAALTRSDPESEIRLFTDGQFTEPVSGLTFAVPVTVERVESAGAAQSGNVSVTQFGVKSAGGAAGSVTAVASLKNWGDTPKQAEVALYAGGKLAEVRTVPVEPGKQASVYFDRLESADWYKLDIGKGDSMMADNVSYAFLEGDRPRNVLLIGKGNLFLEKALQLAGAEVTKLDPDGAAAWLSSQKTGNGPDVVAVDSVTDSVLASAEWSKWLASKPVLYIRSGYAGKETAVPAAPYSIEEHPVTRYLKLMDTHVASVLQPDRIGWGKPIVSAKDVPLLYAGSENGQPRLLIAFSLQQSDLPLRTEFPVLVQNALGWLTAAQGGSLGRAVAGERKEIAVAPAAAAAKWINAEGGQTVSEAEKASGIVSSVQTVPLQPGLYKLEEKDEAGQTVQVRWLGVAADSRESGTGQTELKFAQASPSDGEAGSGEQAGERQGAPLALWRWIVVLVLAVVVWEWGVYRRGTSV